MRATDAVEMKEPRREKEKFQGDIDGEIKEERWTSKCSDGWKDALRLQMCFYRSIASTRFRCASFDGLSLDPI